MFEWLAENWWALWLTVFLVFAVVEMITLDLFFIMLGGGALAGLVADFAGADLWPADRGLLRGFPADDRLRPARRPQTPAQGPGRPAQQRRTPDRRIRPGHGAVSASGGLVKIGGDVWSARSETGVLAPGQHAIVSAIDGATAVVAPQPETAIQ